MAGVSVVELRGCDHFWYFGTWWCMCLLELGASFWLLAGLRFWWMEFSFCIGCYNAGFFGTSCWLAASRMQAGYWHIVVAARWIVAARWNFLCRNLALHVGTF